MCAQTKVREKRNSWLYGGPACLIVQASVYNRLLRQAQHAFSDNVGLDFVAAAVNRGRLGVQPFFHCGQLKVTEAVTLGSKPLEAHQFSLQFRAILLQCGAVEFEYGGCRAGCAGLVLCVCPLGG